jgi:signal transduction histidine kinase/ligand-binding sensor domain-containing protein/DNA-binding response OmpR family regulator
MRKTLLLLLLSPLLATAQHPYRFEQLPSEIGLTQGAVNCIKQDSKGFLWLGTWSGLACYDGYKIRIFQQDPGNPNSLQSDQVTSLLEDREGNLWVGTVNAGFHRFDRATERFVNFRFQPDNDNSLSDNDVWGLFEDSKGYIWIGTKKGLNRFDPKTNAFLRIFAPADGPPSDYIYSICETPDGSIWSATTRGIERIKFRNERDYDLRHYELEPTAKDVALDNFIYRIRPASQEPNTLWLGTKAGLKKIQFSDSDLAFLKIVASYKAGSSSLSHNIVSDFWEESNGNLWVATYHGLNVLEKNTGQFRRFFAQAGEPFTLNNDYVRCLYQDRTGILWIGTDKGLSKLNLRRKPFQSVRFDKTGEATNSIVSNVCNGGSPGVLWVATSGGLNRLDCNPAPSRPVHFSLSPPRLADFANFITTVRRDSEGWLWFATQGAGVMRMRERDIPASGGRLTQLEQFSQNSPRFINDNYVMNLYESSAGMMWFGLWDGGLGALNLKTNTLHHFQQIGELSLTAFPNVAFAEKKEGGQTKFFIGTRGNGLLKCSFDPADNSLHLERQYHFQAGQNGCLSNDKINALYTDSKGRLWVCTSKGLNLLDDGSNTFRVFTTADGLPNNVVQSIVEDGEGMLWVSTQKGIASLRLEANGKTHFRAFDALDGLQDNYFSNSCADRLPSGMLAFGGANGLSLFMPADIKLDDVPPLTQVTDFQLFNRSVPIGEMENGRTILEKSISTMPEIVLNYRDNVLSFEFASLHFAEPKKNRFSYKLEGFNADWVETDASNRSAHYTNLPYREYTFWVKSANPDGIWSEPVSVKVCVQPPFWLSWWAYCIYALLFVALLYAGWRIAHLQAEYRASLALERHKHEKSEELNRLKLQFFTNISHELRTPLTLIISPLEQLLREKTADRPLTAALSRIYQNAGRLLTMINQLLDFRKSEAGLMKLQAEQTNLVFFLREIVLSFKPLAEEHRIKLVFLPENEEITAWIDRDQMEKVLFNLLSNALKFTPDGGTIQVVLKENKAAETVEIRVTDSGTGIAPEQLDKIFDPFHQGAHQPRPGLFGGTGIGLSLVKSILEQHGGNVRAENRLGEGASFVCNFPLGNGHFKPEQIVSETLEQTAEKQFVRPSASTSLGEKAPQNIPAESAPPAHPSEPGLTRRPHLLIVDDNPDIRAYLRENLSADYEISEAADGQEALESALSVSPDLVLSDVAMPRMDGIELCRRLKTDLQTSHIPVVLLTARTALMYKIDGLETGADDYVTKPFNMQLLSLRIKNLIQTREALREKFGRTFDFSPSAVAVSSLDERFLQNLLETVERHIDESEFSIDDLAHALAMSRIQLYRKLKALTGETPNNVIRTIRLKRAAQLLATRQFNVSEVAYKVGFTDLKYFRERFREQFGVNPGEYAG